ncbi:hypothetical protein [Streptomyces sp. NPDC004726]
MSTPASLETLLDEVVRDRESAAADLARAELRRTARAFFGIALEAEHGDRAAVPVRLLSLALADLLRGVPEEPAPRGEPASPSPAAVGENARPAVPVRHPAPETADGSRSGEPGPATPGGPGRAAPTGGRDPGVTDATDTADVPDAPGAAATAPATAPDPAPATGAATAADIGADTGEGPVVSEPGDQAAGPVRRTPARPAVTPDPAAALRDSLLRIWDEHFTPLDQLRHDHLLGNWIRRCRPGAGPLTADRAVPELWDALHLALLRLPESQAPGELRDLLATAAELPPARPAGHGIPALPEGLRPPPGDGPGPARGTALTLTDYRSHAEGTASAGGKVAPPFDGAPKQLGSLLTSLLRDLELLLPRDASLQYWWPSVTKLQAMTLTVFHPQAGQGADFPTPAAAPGNDVSRYLEQLRRSAGRMRTAHRWRVTDKEAAVELGELDAGLGGPVHSVPADDMSWWGTRRRALTRHTRALLREGGYGCAARDIGMSSASRARGSVITADAGTGEPETILWVLRHELLQGGGTVKDGVVVATGARGTKTSH